MPADIANACAFLASDEAAFITGVDLEVGQNIFLIHFLQASSLTRLLSFQVDGGRCV